MAHPEEITLSVKRFVAWPVIFALLSTPALSILVAQNAPSKKPAKLDDQVLALSREIHHQILVLPFYSVFDSIRFTMDGHNVTLAGQVLRRNMKEQAEAAVKSVEGVGVVVNKIEILPASPSDDDLRRAIYRAIYEDSTLARYATQDVPPVHIIVDNGVVSLEGSIDSLSDKNLAGARAGGVANGGSVKNNLVVHAKESAAE
ncbi:MAG: BON domain-containing protein [Candidatus Acidiferrum sp.]